MEAQKLQDFEVLRQSSEGIPRKSSKSTRLSEKSSSADIRSKSADHFIHCCKANRAGVTDMEDICSCSLQRRITDQNDVSETQIEKKITSSSTLPPSTSITKKFALCSCQQSRSYPLCDKTHEIFNRETHSNIQPIVVEVESSPEPRSSPKKQPTEEIMVSSPKSVAKPIRKVDRKKITDVFTVEEVAQHCTADDCWMIIQGNVYDITSYLQKELHPGGKTALLRFAGKDGTENVEFHSGKMIDLLNTYFYIGRVEGTQSSCTIS